MWILLVLCDFRVFPGVWIYCDLRCLGLGLTVLLSYVIGCFGCFGSYAVLLWLFEVGFEFWGFCFLGVFGRLG